MLKVDLLDSNLCFKPFALGTGTQICAIYRNYHVSVFLYHDYQATPEKAWEWCGLPCRSHVFLVDPNTLISKDIKYGSSIYHAPLEKI